MQPLYVCFSDVNKSTSGTSLGACPALLIMNVKSKGKQLTRKIPILQMSWGRIQIYNF